MSADDYAGFRCHKLDDLFRLWEGDLAQPLSGEEVFDEIWNRHPEEYHDVKMHGKLVKTPRWQQAFNRDYRYTGSLNNALPVPQQLDPYWEWAKSEIDGRLNGILVNWYDGSLGHYIGRHRDKATSLIPGAPIVTISLGDSRKFRLRPWRGKGFKDFDASNGCVFILPYDTNENWTHEVPASKRQTGRRISITLRAFEDE